MLTCKQVSKALARGDYAKLPWFSRFGLRLHVVGCIVCGRYNREIMVFYDAARRFVHTEENEDAPAAAHKPELSDAARDRMRQLIARTPPAA